MILEHHFTQLFKNIHIGDTRKGRIGSATSNLVSSFKNAKEIKDFNQDFHNRCIALIDDIR